MNQLLLKTLSQIVNEHHKTASVFEKYNLDYCCKGKRSLLEACNENNVPVNVVVDALESINSSKSKELDFTCIKLYKLVNYIVYTHHSYIKKEMSLILSYLEKVSNKHGKEHNDLYKISELFVDLSNEMRHHIRNEETILFPRIKQLEQDGFEPVPFDIKHYQYLELPIIDMEDDDEDADDKMAKIRKLTNNYTPPANSCTTFRLLYASLRAFETALHQYVHLENNILFPKALALERQLQNVTIN